MNTDLSIKSVIRGPLGNYEVETFSCFPDPYPDDEYNYETMITFNGDIDNAHCEGMYKTEAEARTGHNAACIKLLLSFNTGDVCDELNETFSRDDN